MPASVACPSCQRTLKVPSKLFGKQTICPACGGAMLIPDFSVPMTPVPPSPSTPPVLPATDDFTFSDPSEQGPSPERRHRPNFARKSLCAIGILMAVLVGPGWYLYYRYDVAAQDECAERYIRALRLCRETPPLDSSLDERDLQFLTPKQIDENRRRRQEYLAERAAFDARHKQDLERVDRIETEIQRRWGMTPREFTYRYYERYPWKR